MRPPSRRASSRQRLGRLLDQIAAGARARPRACARVRERALDRDADRGGSVALLELELAERREGVARDEQARRDAGDALEPLGEALVKESAPAPPGAPRGASGRRGDRAARRLATSVLARLREGAAQRRRRRRAAPRSRAPPRPRAGSPPPRPAASSSAACAALSSRWRRLRGQRRLVGKQRSACSGSCSSPNSPARRRQRAAEGDEILLHAAAPGARVAQRSPPAALRQQRVAVLPVRRPAEELVEALEHLGRPHLGREDLVRHGRQLVRLVDAARR